MVYGNGDKTSDDPVKWTRSVDNYARAIDLYLALENALGYFDENDYTETGTSRLLSKIQKYYLIDDFYLKVKDMHNYEYKLATLYGVKLPGGVRNYEIEDGNRPLSIFVSMGYGALTLQACDYYTGFQSDVPDDSLKKNSLVYVDAVTGNDTSTVTTSSYLNEALRSAGQPTTGSNSDNSIRYWNYQTDNGEHFWAEGPYYFEYTLLDVIPFWYATRANNLLNYQNMNISDPFTHQWFLGPFDWLASLVTPDYRVPPLDDGNKQYIRYSYLLNWQPVFGSASVGQKYEWIYKGGHNENSAELVALGMPRVSGQGTAPPENVGDHYAYSGQSLPSQQVLLRKTINNQTHYLLLNGEQGDAITRGEGHEQPDQLQLLYYVDGESYLMDSGYDAPSTEHNSTWNGYNNHNVMTLDYDKNVDHGGLDSPIFDAYSGRKTSSEQQVTDLKLEKLHSGTIYHLSGSVWLHTLHNDNPERWANYKRNVLFINSNKPYVIDLNSITNDYTDDLASFYMQYYGNGTSIWLEGSGWSSWGDPSHPNATRLFISYGAVEFNTDEGYASAGYSSQDATIEETNNDIETIKKIMLTSYGNNHNFNTVAFFRVDNQPPSNLPYTLVPYNGSTTLPNQAWAYRQDANTIDVVAERSHIDTTAFNQPFHFFVKDANGNKLTPLTLPAGKTYGFVRITKQDNYWFVEPDYKLNLEQPDYFAADTTIGTKTFPMNTDIYINNNTTVTVTGTITLQSGTTVHLGTNAVIKTTGSGNIQATGTVFKTLSGSNSASDRWTHIKLEGNGGSTFTQCTFQGASQALYLNSTNTIDRCTFQYNSCGLYAWKGEAHITGSTFINNYDYGIFLGGTGVAATNAYEGSSFIATQITGSNYGVYIYDNAWAELKYTQVDDNNYGAINYNYSILYAGNHNDSGGNASYVSQGWNRFNGNTNYAVYNGSSESDWADDNWWGTTSPPSSYFYGTVSHNNPLTYDPTISGAINVGGGSGCPPNCTFSAVTTSGDQAMNSGKVTTSSNNPSVRKNISDRLSDIYLQLDNHPDADGNYRLLQEAYGLTQLYDREDSSKILTRLDKYSSQYKIVMDVASNQVNTAGKLQSNLFAKSHPLSNVMRKLGTTAVLLKMDYLLHESEWKQMQILADQFAPYVTTNDDKSAFLASRAVAWENQKQFAKALSAYKQIDVMYSDTVLSSNNVAPDYSFIESNLKDSMQVYNQSVVASSRANLQSESSLSKSKTLPKEFSLGDNYPNPFNPTTTFPINLPKESQVKVVIYNITGQRVATLTDRVYQAGRYQLRFDAHHLASGVYIIRARLGEKTFTKQLTLIK